VHEAMSQGTAGTKGSIFDNRIQAKMSRVILMGVYARQGSSHGSLQANKLMKKAMQRASKAGCFGSGRVLERGLGSATKLPFVEMQRGQATQLELRTVRKCGGHSPYGRILSRRPVGVTNQGHTMDVLASRGDEGR
jgi:hypothetical protein